VVLKASLLSRPSYFGLSTRVPSQSRAGSVWHARDSVMVERRNGHPFTCCWLHYTREPCAVQERGGRHWVGPFNQKQGYSIFAELEDVPAGSGIAAIR
jgi:hypothetical protein